MCVMMKKNSQGNNSSRLPPMDEVVGRSERSKGLLKAGRLEKWFWKG